jgi:hypothetical protein
LLSGDVIIFFTAGAALTVLFNTLAAVLTAVKSEDNRRFEALNETSALGLGEEKR